MAELLGAEIIQCADIDEWDAWLGEHSTTSAAVWLTITKKSADPSAMTANEAGDVAICHGWIDGQRRSLDATQFLQRYSPRRPGSTWSRVNVERVAALDAAGRMRPGGLAQVAAAQADGRWAAAYEPQSLAATPDDLVAALAANDRARAAYEAMPKSERYGQLLLPLLKARTPASRARVLQRVVATLEARSARA